MDEAKLARLKAAGFEPTTVAEVFGLSSAESAFVEMRVALTAALRQRRSEADMSQVALAERLNSSQSRVAKIEKGAPGVTIDLIIRAILATGASQRDIAEIIAASASPNRPDSREHASVAA